MYIRAAGPLTVTVLSIAICNIFHLNKAPYNIRVVGTVPAVRQILPQYLVSVADLTPCRNVQPQTRAVRAVVHSWQHSCP